MNDTRISPLAFIGPGVELGAGVTVGPGAVLLGPCVIEDGVWIGSGAQLGGPPEMTDQVQNAAWLDELDHAGVRICAGAVIRENVVIHQGSYRETAIGSGSWVLNQAYVAHDVIVGAGATISAGATIGGHCVIGDRVNIGMNASVHQRRFIGAGVMVGMGTPVTRDVPPYTKAFGVPPRVRGVNTIGMARNGYSDAEIAALTDAYAAGDLLLDHVSVDQWSVELAAALTQWTSREDRNPMTAAFD